MIEQRKKKVSCLPFEFRSSQTNPERLSAIQLFPHHGEPGMEEKETKNLKP